eukprot:GFUD01021052.1.p1 GENE.GFUD01021052.1~~GFUD01021052.1.p1  ORF type:complete len:454 (+),score=115.75 GFUD01021052.1:131-1492(+)
MDNCINEASISMEVGIGAIGEELDYEASDNIEHDEESAEKMESNQHERIVKEVAISDGESVHNSASAERTPDTSRHNQEDSKEVKSSSGSESKKPAAAESDSKSDPEKEPEEKKDAKDKLVASSNSKSACKPCNLVFENKKWLERHNESGDHTHVIKGFNPGGGKYYCYLCWLGFEHSEMMLHHIKRSEHITRARRRGVSDIYTKPASGKSNEKPSQPAKSAERVPHRSGSQSQKPSSQTQKPTSQTQKKSSHTQKPSTQTQKPSSQTHRTSSQSHKSSSLSHRPSSGSSHRSRSPLRIRLSDYYEVSSVGHCDMSGVRLKTLANGVHKSSRDAISNPSDNKSSHKKDHVVPKSVVEVENSIVSEDKSESSARVTNPENGSSDPEPMSVTQNENHDLGSGLSTEPPDMNNSDVCVNQSNDVDSGKSVTEMESAAMSINENSQVPDTDTSTMET